MNLDVVYNKSCQRMEELPDESVDLMPTDPQYGWHFMGKDWDRVVPTVEIWRECFRVLKPGAFAFIMSGPRLDCLTENGMRIREAGFWIGFSPIFWAYASGFPKAQNISKVVDKRLGVKREKGRIRTDGRGKWELKMNRQKGDTGIGHYDGSKQTYQEEFATSPQAKALDGSYAGFQPKPAVEVILVAMKPLSEKTYVDQALRNKKGVTWLDEGVIPYQSNNDKESARFGTQMDIRNNNYMTPKGVYAKDVLASTQGRFPANLLVSDDALNDGRVSKSTGGIGMGKLGKRIYGKFENETIAANTGGCGDSGSFSRYFSLDSWFEKRLRELPKTVQNTFPFLIIPKASKAEKNRGCEELYWEKDGSTFGYHQIDRQRWECLGREEERIYKETGKRVSLRARGNIHPTVKPLKLPSYLITIGSRPGDVIVDPFMGSGTMPMAATILKRHYIAFETEAENVKIAKARLSAIEPRLI